VPAIGGDTLFADMYAAYDGLDEATQARIDGLVAEHDFMRSFAGQVPADKAAEMRAMYPLVEHPVVCTHAVTGRRHLYVNRNFVSRIVGLEPDESRALLDRLCRQADYPEYQVRFHWEPDSIAFWDNRAVQHYASSDYWPSTRTMERASIKGDRPAP
jgi:taurine dioxygenase